MDLGDGMGLSKGRRQFSGIQMDMRRTSDIHKFWSQVTRALEMLDIDEGRLCLNTSMLKSNNMPPIDAMEVCPPVTKTACDTCADDTQTELYWQKNGIVKGETDSMESSMKIEIPLMNGKGYGYGTFIISKNLNEGPDNHFLLRRIQSLKENMIASLEEITEKNEAEQKTDELNKHSSNAIR